MIEFVAASPAHIGTIANRMRDIDAKECAIMGRTPKQALRLSLKASVAAWTAVVALVVGFLTTIPLGRSRANAPGPDGPRSDETGSDQIASDETAQDPARTARREG